MSSADYTVIAMPEAEDGLMTLWLNMPNERAGITRATQQIEAALRTAPELFASPSPTPEESDRLRIDRLPLRAYYFVSAPDRQVLIVGYLLMLSP